MQIFLTGGTGFIGANFINAAHTAGHEIVAHRRSAASIPRVPLNRQPEWVEDSLEHIPGESLAGCEAIVHLASHTVNYPYDTFEACLTENVIKPIGLFRRAAKAGIRRFVVAGSCFEYGLSGARHEFIPPDAPLLPTSSYAASKAAASASFHALACELELELVILRVFQVYGPGEHHTRLWPSLRRAVLAGEDFPMSAGIQIRNFIHVEDVATVFVDALSRNDLQPGQPVAENLGSKNTLSVREFAEAEWKRLGATGKLLPGAIPMRPGEVMRFVPELKGRPAIQ